MPSLLVRVDRALLEAMRERADAVGELSLQAGELPQPDLVHLDPRGVVFGVWLDGDHLRIGMTVHDPELDRGRLVAGDVMLHDHDITHLLARLGCVGEPVEAWSAKPRLLPPNDVDLLRYELGLPVDERTNLVLDPIVLAPEDELDRELLADVWANPDSDAPRMIYADRLQQRSDPRGELIALQLARGSDPPTARERQLIAKWSQACARPLGRYLSSFELRRGFIARIALDDRQPIPPPLIQHPAWRTVEDIQTDHQTILLHAPLPSLHVCRFHGRTLAYLSASDRVFDQVDTLLAFELPPHHPYKGILLQDLAAWQRIGMSPNWPRLRTLSVDAEHPNGSVLPSYILRSPLGQRLEHLDLSVTPANPQSFDPDLLRRELARATNLRRLTLLAELDHEHVPDPAILAFERNAAGIFELALQLPPIGQHTANQLVAWLVTVEPGIDQLELNFLAVRGGRSDPAAVTFLIAELRRLFHEVIVVDDCRPRCPWAYPLTAA